MTLNFKSALLDFLILLTYFVIFVVFLTILYASIVVTVIFFSDRMTKFTFDLGVFVCWVLLAFFLINSMFFALKVLQERNVGEVEEEDEEQKYKIML